MKHFNAKQKNVLMNIVAVLVACIFLFPLYWIVVNSFKLDSEIFAGTPTLWPQQFTLKAYQEQIGSLSVTLKNSVIIAIGSMALALCLSVPAAYGLARYKVRGMKIFVLIFLITQMLPASLVLTPLFLIFSKLGIFCAYIIYGNHIHSLCGADAASGIFKYAQGAGRRGQNRRMQCFFRLF